MNDIDYELIHSFDNEYKADKNNKIIENIIKKVGISNACLNHDVLMENVDIFNIELPKSKIYDQEDSSRCWIHSGINVIKNNIAKNLNINANEFALSVNYLSFVDKLEKANTLYNRVIENNDFNFAKEIKEHYLKNGVYEGGYFKFFISLVNKYGLVPENVMPDVSCSKNSKLLTQIFSEKIKKDIYKLLKLKKDNLDIQKIYEIKCGMLKENYSILSKCLGQLPFEFDYEYRDLDGKCVKISNVKPLDFSKKYLTLDLNDFVCVGNVPMYNKEYNKLYRKKYNENVYKNSYVDFVNMPISVLKDLAIKQLKDGIPVGFACEMRKMRNNELGIMDSNLYNYKDIFGFELLTKEEAISMYDIVLQHIMTITGVHIENEKPIRWKVEDSYGSNVHKNGYYIMNDNYFEDFLFEIFINKKYLSKEQKELFEQEPILIEMDEPF